MKGRGPKRTHSSGALRWKQVWGSHRASQRNSVVVQGEERKDFAGGPIWTTERRKTIEARIGPRMRLTDDGDRFERKGNRSD